MNKTAVLFIFFGVILFVYSIKQLKIRYIVVSAISGIIALIAADYIGSFIGVILPINYFSVSVSALAGIPGVILLTLLQTFI